MDVKWDNSFNAQMYEEYAQTYPIYRETGQKLVELAHIHPGITVIDLACGTAIVTKLILAKLAGMGTVIAVDQSTAMLEIAKGKFPANTVRFLQSSAESLHEVLLEESVDVAVCNCAFWQMRTRGTLEALQRVLRAGARFVFNAPLIGSIPSLQRRLTALLPSLMQQIARDEYGYSVPQRPEWSRLTLEVVKRLLEDSSFTLLSYKVAKFEETAEDAYAFFKIPVMTETYLPGLDYTTRMEIVDKAYHQYDASHTGLGEWGYYILQKQGSREQLT